MNLFSPLCRRTERLFMHSGTFNLMLSSGTYSMSVCLFMSYLNHFWQRFLFFYAACCWSSFLSPQFPHLVKNGSSTPQLKAFFSVSQCIMLSHCKFITHCSTTQIYQVQNVPSCCSTADISELWSVQNKSCLCPLKAGPPVQTFSLLLFDVCQNPKAQAAIYLYQLLEAVWQSGS